MSTHNIPFSIYIKMTLINIKSAAMGFFPRDLKNEFEIAVVNKPSVFLLYIEICYNCGFGFTLDIFIKM